MLRGWQAVPYAERLAGRSQCWMRRVQVQSLRRFPLCVISVNISLAPVGQNQTEHQELTH